MRDIFATDYYAMEADVITRLARTTEVGVPFDVDAAQKLYVAMQESAADSATEVQRLNPPLTTDEVFIPKRGNKTKGYLAGVPFIKYKTTPLNPNSSQQLAARATDLGYQHTDFTDGGGPCMNATVSAKVAALYPEFIPILEHKVTSKRITMLAEGEKSWLNMVSEDGRLRTDYNTLGTVTFRSSHTPNIAQVPRVVLNHNGDVIWGVRGHWGADCRSLFHAGNGYMVGVDVSSLELCGLAHYLHPFDGGAYVAVVTTGDPHALTQKIAGLATRARAKTLNFAVVYGCGAMKAGHIVEPDETDDNLIRLLGQMAKADMIDGITGFRDLLDWVQNEDPLIGLDGRILTVRKKHAALNVLIQSAGAIVCKRWLLMVDDELQRLGLRPYEQDYELLIWCHDELQYYARTMEIAETIKDVAERMIVKVGAFYQMACPLAGTGKIGRTWQETH